MPDFGKAAYDLADKAANNLVGTYYNTTFMPINRNTNLFNKYSTIDGQYRGYTSGILSANASFCVSDFIQVKPNTNYTVNDASQQFNIQVCFFDRNQNFISGTQRATTIVTPPNAAFLTLSVPLTLKSITMLREGTGIGQPYIEPFSLNFPDSSVKKSMIETMTVDDLEIIRFAVTLTVDATYTSATTGWGVTAFNSLITAHNSITDASKDKRYKILVKPGSYSDWETVWPGLDAGVNYRGIIVKDYVYFEGTDKYKCILNWDGFAGCTTGYVMTVSECMQKCIFHITTAANTYIKGFTIHTKNTRYCIHPESAGSGNSNKWLIKDCELYWEGRPNCVDTTGGNPIGIGISPSEDGIIENVAVYNGVGLVGIGGHNNPNNNAASRNYGTLKLKNVDMNGTTIGFQTISSNGETDYDQLTLEDVNNIKFLQLSPSNDVRCKRVNFRATLKGSTNPRAYQTWSPDPTDRYIPAYPNVMAILNGTGALAANKPVGVGADGKAYAFLNTSPMNEFAGYTLTAVDANVYGKIQRGGWLYVSNAATFNRFDLLLPDFTVTTDKTKATLMVMEVKNSAAYYYCQILNSNF